MSIGEAQEEGKQLTSLDEALERWKDLPVREKPHLLVGAVDRNPELTQNLILEIFEDLQYMRILSGVWSTINTHIKNTLGDKYRLEDYDRKMRAFFENFPQNDEEVGYLMAVDFFG